MGRPALQAASRPPFGLFLQAEALTALLDPAVAAAFSAPPLHGETPQTYLLGLCRRARELTQASAPAAEWRQPSILNRYANTYSAGQGQLVVNQTRV